MDCIDLLGKFILPLNDVTDQRIAIDFVLVVKVLRLTLEKLFHLPKCTHFLQE